MKRVYSASIYSEISEFYHELFPVDRSLVDSLSKALPVGSKILDMGCGNGQLAGELTRHKYQVSGIDADRQMIENAAMQYPDAVFKVRDMLDISKISLSFDCILCVGNVISYIPNPEKHRLVRLVFALLNSGGYWITQFMNWDALLHRKSFEFPDKHLTAREVIFRRSYPSIDSDSVLFRKELETPSQRIIEEDQLFPIKVKDYLRIHSDAGFELIGHGHDFKGTPYNPRTPTGNGFVWQKR